jgi:hypothetical protein
MTEQASATCDLLDAVKLTTPMANLVLLHALELFVAGGSHFASARFAIAGCRDFFRSA